MTTKVHPHEEGLDDDLLYPSEEEEKKKRRRHLMAVAVAIVVTLLVGVAVIIHHLNSDGNTKANVQRADALSEPPGPGNGGESV